MVSPELSICALKTLMSVAVGDCAGRDYRTVSQKSAWTSPAGKLSFWQPMSALEIDGNELLLTAS